MESITIKVHKEMAREIDALAYPDFGTRTEFVREAIREKIETMRKDKVLGDLAKYFGKLKPKDNLTDEQVREIVGKEILKKHGLD